MKHKYFVLLSLLLLVLAISSCKTDPEAPQENFGDMNALIDEKLEGGKLTSAVDLKLTDNMELAEKNDNYVGDYYVIGSTGNLTLDLNNKTLKVNNAGFDVEGTLTIKNGTIEANNNLLTNSAGKNQPKYGRVICFENGSTVNLENVIIRETSEKASVEDNSCVIIAWGGDGESTLNIKKGTRIYAKSTYAISGNGLYTKNTTINVEEGSYIEGALASLFLSCSKEMNISGEIKAKVPVYARSGIVNIKNGAVITSTTEIRGKHKKHTGIAPEWVIGDCIFLNSNDEYVTGAPLLTIESSGVELKVGSGNNAPKQIGYYNDSTTDKVTINGVVLENSNVNEQSVRGNESIKIQVADVKQ